jgi:hypothetical protein
MHKVRKGIIFMRRGKLLLIGIRQQQPAQNLQKSASGGSVNTRLARLCRGCRTLVDGNAGRAEYRLVTAAGGLRGSRAHSQQPTGGDKQQPYDGRCPLSQKF